VTADGGSAAARGRPVWRAVHRESGRIVAERVVVAETITVRARGWIGRRPERGEGLWLPRCAWIHTAGLRAPIDVVWCGPDGFILRVDRSLSPWRMAAARGAQSVCEVSDGNAIGLLPGDHLDFVIGDIMNDGGIDDGR
jgi:uncharacterized protein